MKIWGLFQKQSNAMEYKKTDAPQPDVKEEEEEKEEEKDKGDEDEEGEEKLEEKQKSDAEEDGGTVSQEEEDRKPKAEVKVGWCGSGCRNQPMSKSE
ncbi:PREDICTED: calnexin-like [Dipodomys ordii]|uniref:Calnexin-like n=1 Tax=Dipodomys ordii TaxID=10020 RepID=A0A1S3GWJ1_DIPOR|nr:PREDICTED: calnexin-like [Dipodomys ordii]